MANADKVVYLCDSEKFGMMSGYKQCTLGQVDYLICEKAVPAEWKKKYPNLRIL